MKLALPTIELLFMIILISYAMITIIIFHKFALESTSKSLLEREVPADFICGEVYYTARRFKTINTFLQENFGEPFNRTDYLGVLRARSSMNILVLRQQYERHCLLACTFPNSSIYMFVKDSPNLRLTRCFTGDRDRDSDLRKSLQYFKMKNKLDVVAEFVSEYEINLSHINFMIEHGLKPGEFLLPVDDAIILNKFSGRWHILDFL